MYGAENDLCLSRTHEIAYKSPETTLVKNLCICIHMYCVFKCLSGLGNRLCNIMNMWYVHKAYPNLPIYLIWPKNEHCNIDFSDLFDIQEHTWIQHPQMYFQQLFPRHRHEELWAGTSRTDRSRWDRLEEWAKHKAIVSVSFHLYEFVPYEFCIDTFHSLQPTMKIQDIVQQKIQTYGLQRNLIHIRTGDLAKCLELDTTQVAQTLDKLRAQYENVLEIEYNKETLERSASQMEDALADLLFFSKHCNLVAYCPYSWFSSWICLLSPEFQSSYPIFHSNMLAIQTISKN